MTEHNPDGWTFASLTKWITDLREADAKHAASIRADDQRAISAALASAEKRADASNEIRGAMIDQQKNFATQDKVDGMAAQITEIKLQLSATDGKSKGIGASFANINTVLILGFGAIALALKFFGHE